RAHPSRAHRAVAALRGNGADPPASARDTRDLPLPQARIRCVSGSAPRRKSFQYDLRVASDHKTILIVEDDEDARTLFFDLFTGRGYEPIAVPDGLQALAVLDRLVPA